MPNERQNKSDQFVKINNLVESYRAYADVNNNPCFRGKPLAWDVTGLETFIQSYLKETSILAGAMQQSSRTQTHEVCGHHF